MKREGWYDPEENNYTIPVVMGPKTFICPFCQTHQRVAPTKNSTGRYWDYEGNCDLCGDSWVNRFHAWRRPTPHEKTELRSVLPLEED